MSTFETPTDLMNNRGLIADPEAFAREKGAASWLYLCGEEFASMEGGMSYEDVQRAVPVSANVVSDPPTELSLELARRQIEALDGLPRPTLVTCRPGPRTPSPVPRPTRRRSRSRKRSGPGSPKASRSFRSGQRRLSVPAAETANS